MEQRVHMTCPICGNQISALLRKEQEKGEFGVILAEWLEMDSDPNSFDHGSYCRCDFSKPLAEVLSDYYNEGDLVYSLLSPEPLTDEEYALLSIVADAGPDGLTITDLSPAESGGPVSDSPATPEGEVLHPSELAGPQSEAVEFIHRFARLVRKKENQS